MVEATGVDGSSVAERPPLATWLAGLLILLGLVAALVTYKAAGAVATVAKAQASHTLRPRSEAVASTGLAPAVRPLVRAVNYLAIVWPALVFGVLIGAAVRALIPAAWVARVLGASSGHASILGGLAGVPLMLCSCCVAPVFAALHERTRRADAPGALLLAAPSLNPATLALTFLLFAPRVALVRGAMALLLVFGVSALAARTLPAGSPGFSACGLEAPEAAGIGRVLAVFLREVWRLGRMTLPVIAGGVLASALLLEVVSLEWLAVPSLRLVSIVAVALVSVPLAVPTFAEIPLALGLLAAGAPAGAAVALLIAAPAINLPSLFTVSRLTTPRYALTLAGGTFFVAVVGGLLA